MQLPAARSVCSVKYATLHRHSLHFPVTAPVALASNSAASFRSRFTFQDAVEEHSPVAKRIHNILHYTVVALHFTLKCTTSARENVQSMAATSGKGICPQRSAAGMGVSRSCRNVELATNFVLKTTLFLLTIVNR